MADCRCNIGQAPTLIVWVNPITACSTTRGGILHIPQSIPDCIHTWETQHRTHRTASLIGLSLALGLSLSLALSLGLMLTLVLGLGLAGRPALHSPTHIKAIAQKGGSTS